jgi:hypothetical protein
VRELRKALEPDVGTVADIPPFDLKAAYALYALLLKPVEQAWKPAKSLTVVTNGALGLLPLSLLPTAPFELKPDADSGLLFAHYREVPWLARTHAVTTVPSTAALRTLRQLPASVTKREQLIGFGDPLFSAEQAAERSPPQEVVQVAASGMRGLPLRRRASPQTHWVDSAALGLALPPSRQRCNHFTSELGLPKHAGTPSHGRDGSADLLRSRVPVATWSRNRWVSRSRSPSRSACRR